MFNLINMDKDSSLFNGVFVVNVSIDCSKLSGRLSFSLFDSVFGSLKNISAVGTIYLDNMDFDKFDFVRLSSFFGNVGLQDDERTYNGTMIENVYSSLKYIVNGSYEVKRTTDKKTVLISLDNTGHIYTAAYLEKVQLCTCFDQKIQNGINFSIQKDKESFDLTPQDTTGLNLEKDYDQINTTGLDIPVPKVPVKVLNKIKTQFKTVNLPIIDPLSNQSYFINTTIGFDYNMSTNAVDDFYSRALMRQKEIDHETNGMYKSFYNLSGFKQDLINPTRPDIVVYNSKAKAVGIWENNVFICENGTLFSVITKQCVFQCSFDQFRLDSICIAACPSNMFTVSVGGMMVCMDSCPTHLGQVRISGKNKCQWCSVSAFVTEQGCATSADGLYKFGSGYFENCPDGLIVQDKTCVQPVTCDKSQFQFLVDFQKHPSSFENNKELFNFCSNKKPAGMLNIINSNIFTWTCPYGTQFINMSCAPNLTLNCTQNDIKQITIKDNGLKCESQCTNNQVNDSITCAQKCSGLLYKQTTLGACNPCQSDQYDNGKYFVVSTGKCAMFCDYYIIENPLEAGPKQCQVSCSAPNLKYVLRKHNSTHWNKQCVASCVDINMVESNGQCIQACTKYLDITGKICVNLCENNQILNIEKKQCTAKCPSQQLPDGSVVQNCPNCTYQDLNYDPPMCLVTCKLSMKKNDILVCVDKCPNTYYLNTVNQISTCVDSCASQGRYVSQNNVCVDTCKIYSQSGKELVCQNFCEDEQIVVDNKVFCYIDCGMQISSDKSCVDSCPAGTYFYLKLCLSSCPATFTPFEGKCIESNQKVSNWVYIVIFVCLSLVIAILAITFFIIRRRKLLEGKRIKKENSVHKDTMYYAKRVQISPKKRTRDTNLQIGSQLLDSTYTDETLSQLGTSTVSDTTKQKKKRLVKIKEYDGSIPDDITNGGHKLVKKVTAKQAKVDEPQETLLW
ncbi:Conserved_hypothetical protein [Hexamita inflata]|uniref:Uncharacterized protein n=1 Tax=Hexamita inflata TaxID=28002 RepID=A0AA86UUG4_9EUKA|nr:Conserved hypothetical protein [Hexamita inflata]